MAIEYNKQTWTDIDIDGERRYSIKQGSTDIADTAEIDLVTPVIDPGTPVTAARMNHMEEGIENAYVQIESILERFEAMQKQTINKIYPVGSLYMSVSATNPASFLGGAWVQWGNGRALVAVGNNGEHNYTGAEQHFGLDGVTLSVAQMPSHDHAISLWKYGEIDIGYLMILKGESARYMGSADSVGTGYTGQNQAHENRQRSITCYVWKRTA